MLELGTPRGSHKGRLSRGRVSRSYWESDHTVGKRQEGKKVHEWSTEGFCVRLWLSSSGHLKKAVDTSQNHLCKGLDGS